MWLPFCAATERHGDHAKYLNEIDKYGIPIYSNSELGMYYPCARLLLPKHKYNIGDFKAMPLQVPHGETENYAYIIDHPSTGRIVFATDCEDFPYEIDDVTTLMIEANYSEEILMQKMMDGVDIRSQSQNHMEINRAISVIERLQSPKLRRVVLLHLSDNLSDERAFIERVKEAVGDFVEVYAADKGMKIGIDKEMF